MARRTASLVLTCVCLALGCASDHRARDDQAAGTGAPPSEPEPEPQSDRALEIAFNPMYSAYDDGDHLFHVPVKVSGAEGTLKVRSMPPDFVDYRKSEVGVTLTTRRAGKATIIITDAAGNSGSADLTVTQNERYDVDVGKERYHNQLDGDPSVGAEFDSGVASFPGGVRLPSGGFVLPEGGFVFPEGGLRLPEGGLRFFEGGVSSARANVAPCVSCHAPISGRSPGNDLQFAGEYTPQQTAGYTDEELGRIITAGVKPTRSPFTIVNLGERGAIRSDTAAAQVFAGFHAWKLDPDTLRGVIAYLRSLEPRSLATLDSAGREQN